eukprot:4755316-Karenia_brevis.AAC.1
MSVPLEPTGKGAAQWRGHNSRDRRGGRGGRGRGGRGRNEESNWENWDNDTNYRAWQNPKDANYLIYPKGKGKDQTTDAQDQNRTGDC